MRALSDVLSGGYGQARAQARRGDARALDEVARQFEAYFLQQMLKSMREASFGDPIFGSRNARLYRELFDHQLSLQLAAGRGIGFGALLERQLAGAVPASTAPVDAVPPSTSTPPPAHAMPSASPEALGPISRALGAEARLQRLVDASPPVAPAGVTGTTPAEALPRLDSPEAFVRALRPHAERAGAALGVRAELLLAQSALETGWGRHVAPGPSGRDSSHNFFGIKADNGWDGPRVSKQTLEYVDGVMSTRSAPFRAYESAAASFEDYVRFIQDNARYEDARREASNPERYVRELQRAGYATDPDYADKILALLARPPLAG